MVVYVLNDMAASDDIPSPIAENYLRPSVTVGSTVMSLTCRFNVLQFMPHFALEAWKNSQTFQCKQLFRVTGLLIDICNSLYPVTSCVCIFVLYK